MKVIKILNNNIVYARDRHGYAIVMGKGIGFNGKTGQKVDLERIEKIIPMDSKDSTKSFVKDLERIPSRLFELSNKIVDYAAQKLNCPLNGNVYITLTDHISFSLERYDKGLVLSNPLLWEIKHYYPAEFDIGRYSTDLIHKVLNVDLGEDEAAFIAMHIVSARYNSDMLEMMDTTKLMTNIISIVEAYFNCRLAHSAYDFQRFVTHVRFLAERIISKGQLNAVDGMDNTLIQMVKDSFKHEFLCSIEVSHYVKEQYQHIMSEMELTYLTVHLRNLRKGNLSNQLDKGDCI